MEVYDSGLNNFEELNAEFLFQIGCPQETHSNSTQ